MANSAAVPGPRPEAARATDRKRDLRDAAIAIGLVAGVLAGGAAIDAAKRSARSAVRRRVQRAIRKQAVKLLRAELKRAIDEL